MARFTFVMALVILFGVPTRLLSLEKLSTSGLFHA